MSDKPGKDHDDSKSPDKPSRIHRIQSAEECSSSNAETCSVTSESSAAIVSLYNCWSSVDTTNNSIGKDSLDDDDSLMLDHVVGFNNSMAMMMMMNESTGHLRKELKRRLPAADVPTVPRIRKRRPPNCRFVNFMGTRLPPLPLPPPPPINPINPLNDLGLDETDALFPLVEQTSGSGSGSGSGPQPKDEEEKAKLKHDSSSLDPKEEPAKPVNADRKEECQAKTLGSCPTKDVNPKIST
mmetsp:Transcript_3188/g.8015  ORF Transcript_3188/g.8015 Transcript_3188/m.8015 type:complete len:240 (-) Transcript_3188:353-1072(-)